MNTNDFNFELPEELIAQTPLQQRANSRLLVLHRDSRDYEDKHFYDIIDYLKPGDVLVRNNTRVLPARLFGTKEETNAHVELLLLKQNGNIWQCLVGNARVVKLGTTISFNNGELKAKCTAIYDKGIRDFEMIYEGVFLEILERLGNVPLPPYIKTQLQDKERYQTIYSKVEGSAAAPTAGLHFTTELFDKISEMGVEILDVTLHIGLGTFRPVAVEDISNHQMHSEWYQMSQEVAQKLNLAKKENRRIIAVGTTTTRTLEAIVKKFGNFQADMDETSIFIYPGYKFEAIDAQITNFHLPKSTLLMLVSAFADKQLVLEAYQHAVKERYRFFSFGDSMLIL